MPQNVNFGTDPALVSVTVKGEQTLLASGTPAYGNFRRVAVTAPVARNSLIRADGALAAAGETAVGIVRDGITAAQIATSEAPVYVQVATSGHFIFQALVVAASITTPELAQTAVDAGYAPGVAQIKITSNPAA